MTLTGSHPGCALRVMVEPGPGGYVRLQQLAHDAGLGWYVQRSFVIPGEMLSTLVPQLRKADCLIPRRRIEWGQETHRLPPASPPLPEAGRRGA